jgi:hypothetical protein
MCDVDHRQLAWKSASDAPIARSTSDADCQRFLSYHVDGRTGSRRVIGGYLELEGFRAGHSSTDRAKNKASTDAVFAFLGQFMQLCHIPVAGPQDIRGSKLVSSTLCRMASDDVGPTGSR